jgi:hypothetical protein
VCLRPLGEVTAALRNQSHGPCRLGDQVKDVDSAVGADHIQFGIALQHISPIKPSAKSTTTAI